jgi:hypothetical protein
MALERCKYAIGQALKYFRLLKGDKGSKTFLLQHVNPNHLRELNCDLPPEKKLFKVRIIDEFVFCSCMEYFNTGLPCTHQFYIALKRHKKLLFHERWFLRYESQAAAHPQHAMSIANQNKQERLYIYQQLLKPDRELAIEKDEIKIK